MKEKNIGESVWFFSNKPLEYTKIVDVEIVRQKVEDDVEERKDNV